MTISTYIVEVAYEKTYHKTFDEHVKILRDYEVSHTFRNSWKQSIIRNLIGFKEFFMARTNLNRGLINLVTYSLGMGIVSALLVTGQIRNVIPIVPATSSTNGILYIPANRRKHIPRDGNAEYNREGDIHINIRSSDFDKLLNDIAENYDGHVLEKGTKTLDGIHSVMYEFTTESKNVENKIKQFFFSLPVNVFVRHVYKLQGNTDVHERLVSSTHSRILLFPRIKKLESMMIPESSLTFKDMKIIEYAQINMDLYNRINKNVKYLLDHVKSLQYLQALLPKKFRIPEYSPFVKSK